LAGHVAQKGEIRMRTQFLVGKPHRKRPLGRPRHRQEDNIKIYFREIDYEGVD
jgi:hypothetical protein